MIRRHSFHQFEAFTDHVAPLSIVGDVFFVTIVNFFFTTIFSSDRSSCFQVVSLNSLFNLYTIYTINTSEPRASSSRFVGILVQSFLEVPLLGSIATSSPTSTDFGVRSGIGGVSSFLAQHNAIFLCYLG